jgi:hypothetical protein
MKNKLVLLLFLLMPSLCFAESLSISGTYITNPLGKHIYALSFVWSKKSFRDSCTFKCPSRFQIVAEDNKEELQKLRTILKNIFPNASPKENSFLNAKAFNAFTMLYSIESCAILENFAVTFKESTKFNTIYFYKPDK